MECQDRKQAATVGRGAATRLLQIFVLCLSLIACGGGGSSPPSGSSVAGTSVSAPTALFYTTPLTFTVGRSISALSPTVTGSVVSYRADPTLPAGLNIDAGTGVISGTPTTIAAAANYTITASNSAGSTTALVMIAVNDSVPSVAYVSYYGYTANIQAQTVTPASTGGAVTSWSINPSLPAGLVFNATDGSISGTPTVALAATEFTATASNTGGQVSATFKIAVSAAPLLDVGHATGVQVLRFNGSQLLSFDAAQHWLLQDFASGHFIASGDGVSCATSTSNSGCVNGNYLLVDLAGPIAMIVQSDATRILSASSGAQLALLPSGFDWYRLASDGSYICAGNAASLMAWNPSGQVLLSRPGDYSAAVVFAAPTQINVATGPAGGSAIESIATATGVASVGPAFQGNFDFWFVDGSGYLTTAGSVIRVYTSGSNPLEVMTLNGTPLFGLGSWIGVDAGTGSNEEFDIYAVGGSTPAYSMPGFQKSVDRAVPSGNTIAVLPNGTGQVTVIDLSGGSPSAGSPHSVPIAYLTAYAATSSSNWVVGNTHGVLLDASLRPLTAGKVFSISAGTDFFSVATASGSIFNFDAMTDLQVGSIQFTASQLAMSSSGAVLAALQSTNDQQFEPSGNVDIYSLPSGSLLRTVTLPGVTQANLSGSGTMLGVATSTQSSVYSVADGTQSFTVASHTDAPLPQFSPDGTRFAVSPDSSATSLYQNGVLSGAIANAVATTWLDNNSLLAAQLNPAGGDNDPSYLTSALYGPSGSVVAVSPVSPGTVFQLLPSGGLYAAGDNDIVSASTGVVTWESGDGSQSVVNDYLVGAASGTQVIFPSGHYVLVQPHP